jgi:hypothetical protein
MEDGEGWTTAGAESDSCLNYGLMERARSDWGIAVSSFDADSHID